MKPLSQEELAELLKPQEVATTGATPEPQHGPLRWYDKELRCARRRCGSPTYCKVRGVPTCMMHAIVELNEICVELGMT